MDRYAQYVLPVHSKLLPATGLLIYAKTVEAEHIQKRIEQYASIVLQAST
jgi:hypothetical protein